MSSHRKLCKLQMALINKKNKKPFSRINKMQFNSVSETHVGIMRYMLTKNVSWTAGLEKKNVNPNQSKCKHTKKVFSHVMQIFILVPTFEDSSSILCHAFHAVS